MDHIMPEMDGVETTRELRKKHGKEDLVMIALTANAVEGAREMLLAGGMNDYLSKPIEREPLQMILRKWLPANKIRQCARLEFLANDWTHKFNNSNSPNTLAFFMRMMYNTKII